MRLLSWVLNASLLLMLCAPFAKGDTINLHVLEEYYQALAQIQQICGRYPTTTEGLSAITERPPMMTCPNGSREIWKHPELPGDRRTNIGTLEYASDGETYRVSGRRSGFFVTNSSPKRAANGDHWGDPSILVALLGLLGFPDFQNVVSLVLLIAGLGLIFMRKRAAKKLQKQSIASAAEMAMLWSGIVSLVMAILVRMTI